MRYVEDYDLGGVSADLGVGTYQMFSCTDAVE